MQIRITKQRAAMAALFVLAGIGLGSLLSPLVGTALATAGQIVNISDRSGSAYFAKVTSAGELKTNAVVSGKVAPALPPQPFSVRHSIIYASSKIVLGPTTATVALTDVTLANYFSNGARRLSLQQSSAAAPNAACASARGRGVVTYSIPSGAQTVVQDFTTPIVLKPLASGDAWCLYASMSAPAVDINATVLLTLGGYVLSGTFTP
jgi:hypothetical protein